MHLLTNHAPSVVLCLYVVRKSDLNMKIDKLVLCLISPGKNTELHSFIKKTHYCEVLIKLKNKQYK